MKILQLGLKLDILKAVYPDTVRPSRALAPMSSAILGALRHMTSL